MTEREERQPEALDAERTAAKQKCQQKIEDLLDRRKKIMREMALRRDDNGRNKTQAKAKTGPKAKAKPKRAAQASTELLQINEEIKRYKTMLRRLEGARGGRRGPRKKKARGSGSGKAQQMDAKTEQGISKAEKEAGYETVQKPDKPKIRKKKRRNKKGRPWAVI